jgi:hypothetical protein
VRREAARAVSAAQNRLGDSAFTLALTLSHDRDYSVRATAAWSLARLRTTKSPAFRVIANERLEDLLSEAGTTVPSGALNGLLDAIRDGERPDDVVMHQVARIRKSHPSRTVKQLASSVQRAAA